MNKAERITDLNNRVVKIIGSDPVNTINGGDKEFSSLNPRSVEILVL